MSVPVSEAPLAFDAVESPSTTPRGYLDSLNLLRVVACVVVVAQHAFIWTDMSHNVVGTLWITMLHMSRNSFFFITGLVICYSQVTRPRPLARFWKRRYVQLGVPYLVWTAVYLVYTLIITTFSWHEVAWYLRHYFFAGYSQLYAIVVIFQFYLLFPLFLRLLRRTRHHGAIMLASLGFAFLLGMVLHFPSLFDSANHVTANISSVWAWSRDFFGYQEYFVAGVLVAYHLDEVLDFVSRHYRRIWAVTGVAAAVTITWYVVSVNMGIPISRASDIYQPIAVAWSLAAIAGVFALSWWWDRHRIQPAWTASLAALTGGIYFCHELFMDTIRTVLETLGVWTAIPWWASVSILLVGTLLLAGTLVSLELRTNLRWPLTGPLRAEQRARVNAAAAAVAVP